MIRSKVTKNIISVILAVVTLFFGVYVAFARVQAAEVSFVDDSVDYYFDDDGYIHAVYQDRDTACPFRVSDVTSYPTISGGPYCYVYDCINDVIFLLRYSSSGYSNYLKSVIFNYSPTEIYRDFSSSTSDPYVYFSIYDYSSSSIYSYGSNAHTTSSRYYDFYLADWLSRYSSFGYSNISDSIYLIPLYSNTNWKGSFAVDGSLLSNVPADYQYNYIYYDPNTTYYTFLTWSVPVGTHYGGTFYSQGGSIGTYKIYTSQNGSDWTWHASGYAGTFTFSTTYLGDNISPIYYSDDYGRTGANNDNFPEDYSIQDTLDDLSHISISDDFESSESIFIVSGPGQMDYYQNVDFLALSMSYPSLHFYTCEISGLSSGNEFIFGSLYDQYDVGDIFSYDYLYLPSYYMTNETDYVVDGMVNTDMCSGVARKFITQYEVTSECVRPTISYYFQSINNNLATGFDGVNDTIISLNDNIGEMLSSVHLRLGNIYTRLSVTNDYLDSMNGSLSSLNTSISNGFDDVISAINDLGSDDSSGSGSVDLSGVEDKIDDLNSNVDEWQSQFNGFATLLWIALGFDEDEVGDDDPNLPNIIEFIQGAVTGSAIGTALGYFNSFDTDTMNGIHFVNDTLSTIWTTCAPLQPLLVGGAVLLVAGMIVKRN